MLLLFFFSRINGKREREKKWKQSAPIMAYLMDRYLTNIVWREFRPTHSNSSICGDQSQKWHIKFQPILLLLALIEFVFEFLYGIAHKQTIFRVSVLIFYPLFFLFFSFSVVSWCSNLSMASIRRVAAFGSSVEENDDFIYGLLLLLLLFFSFFSLVLCFVVLARCVACILCSHFHQSLLLECVNDPCVWNVIS